VRIRRETLILKLISI